MTQANKLKNKKVGNLEKTEREQHIIDQGLKDLLKNKDCYLNPSRFFQINEKVDVICANWNNCQIVETREELFYLVEYTTDNFGRGPITSHKSWKPWNRIKKRAEFEPDNFNRYIESERFNISFHNTTIMSLLSKYFFFGVNMNPEYQRGDVWSLEDKEKLIDSIFEGIEIGKFAFIRLDCDKDGPMYEILDGKQRLTTIVDFTLDRFPFKGRYFSELSTADQSYFENYHVTSGETRELTSVQQRAQYFLRLNTGGVNQDEDHLKKVKEIIARTPGAHVLK